MKRAASVAGQASHASAWLLACLLILLGEGAAPRSAAASAPFVHAPTPSVAAAASPARQAGFIDYVLGNRSRMIQIATLAMLLGLFILMRK